MKIGMLFPGYGNQFVGMGKELYDNSRIVQEYFEEASSCLGINFVKLCFASSDAELSKITHAYPALFLVSVATAALVKELKVPMSAVAGHGLGEYSALCTAEGLSFPDGLYLLSKLALFYTQLRQELQNNDIKSVLVEGISAKKLKQACSEHSFDDCLAHIAVYENKTEHVLTGPAPIVDAVIETVYDKGADGVKEMHSEEGFHTPLLTQLVEQLKMYLTKVDFKDLKIPLISNVDAKELCLAKKAQEAVMRQITEPLYWNSVLKQFADTDLLLVAAPAKMIVTELESYYPQKKIIGIATVNDIELLKEIVAKMGTL